MRIAITGIGIISAIGSNPEECERSILSGRSGVVPLASSHPLLNGLPAGVVSYSDAHLMSVLGITESLPRTVLLAIYAARQALQSPNDHCDFAFVNGNTVGGMDFTERHYAEWRGGGECSALRYHDVGTCTSLIASHLDGVAYSTSISTACSSSLNSLIAGANLIRTGRYERVLAGGTECLTRFHMLGFQSLSILSRELCRPFDSSRDGINLGEGAAYVLLESEQSALNRGAHIFAYLSGYGNACDAYHQTASSPEGEGAFLAMSQALCMSGLNPSDIDYINAHGTATIDNDSSESAAIRRLFPVLPRVSSTKALTGHTTSASGGIESVISILALAHGCIPSSHNWHTLDPNCIKPVTDCESRVVRSVMCNSFGFGGNDTSVIFQSPDSDVRQFAPMRPVSVHQLSAVSLSPGDDYSSWFRPIEARRLSQQMRLIVAAASQALSEAGIDCPDAIVTATALGTIGYTRQLLDSMADSPDDSVRPSLFMYSTHNSISSLLAIRLHCHGHNCTISNGESSAADARLYAEMLLQQGDIRNVLLLCFDEEDMVWSSLLDSANLPHKAMASATVLCSL